MLQLVHGDAFQGTLSAHGHEHRGVDSAVRESKSAGSGLTHGALRHDTKNERNSRGHNFYRCHTAFTLMSAAGHGRSHFE